MKALRPLPLLALLASVFAACSGSGGSSTPSAASTASSAVPAASPGSITLNVLAASSLTKAFQDIKAAYEGAHPGVSVNLSFGASSTLETQIEQGAPADVFASADTTNPGKLVTAGLAFGAVTSIAGNTLAVIVPTTNPAGIASLLDMAKAGVKVIAAGDTVPITKYASQLLANLAKQSGYPTDFAAKVTSNIVSKEDNVAAVVSKIELAEGDAAIVYVTDAKASTKLTQVAVPGAANVPATYGAVVIKASRSPDAATAFLTWLSGSDGQAILARYGFLPTAP